MFRVNRFDYFALALVLVESFTTLTGHFAAHAKVGTELCLMCASHADLTGTEPVPVYAAAIEISVKSATDLVSVKPLPCAFVQSFQSRAPPRIS